MKISTLLLGAIHAQAKECNLDCAPGKTCDFRNGEQICRRERYCDNTTCGFGEVCSNKDAACICDTGFTRHNSTNQCVVDPCGKTGTPCHKFANCAATHEADGSISASCTCREGKVGDGFQCAPDKCYSGKDRCGANSNCAMVQVDDKWDYECFCKSGHVSYSTKHSEDILATLGLNGVGGYREPCEEFKCNYEGEQQNQGHHTNEDSRYKVFVPSNDPNDTDNGPLAWEAAKQMCMEYGNLWDLAVISTPEEMQRVVDLTKCSHHAFWVGVKKPWIGSGFRNIFNEPAKYLPWATDFPTTNEREQCVRMHLGKFNNANCRATTSKKRTNDLGMGYICEKHSKRPDMGVKCEAKDNQRIAAFKTAPGCPKPECLGKGKFKIVDAWKKKSNNALYQYDYGFSALVTLPSTAFDESGGSILLRFANGNRQGNIQTWNFKYFGFYNNNNDILLHTKYWSTDRAGATSHLITVENINTPDYPDIFYWPNRVNNHRCFQNNISRSGAGGGSSVTNFIQVAQSLNHKVMSDEDVTSVSFKNGEIRRVQIV